MRVLDKLLSALAALLVMLAGCSTGPVITPAGAEAKAPQQLLTPWQVLKGGRLASQMDANGFPVPGSIKGYTAFVYPSAVAARANTLYVADAGIRQVYRYNPEYQALTMVPLSAMSGVTVSANTRLQVTGDQSLFILNPARSEITRYARGGQELQRPYSPLPGAHLTEFVVTESLDRMYVVDQLNQQLVMLHPHGQAGRTLITSGVGGIASMGAVASVGRKLYLVDAGCICIVTLDENGRMLEQVGQEELRQPHALVADRYGRIYVADGFDRTLKIFMEGAMIGSYPAHKLQVTEITALALDQGILYIADGPGAQVVSFRIRPPTEGIK